MTINITTQHAVDCFGGVVNPFDTTTNIDGQSSSSFFQLVIQEDTGDNIDAVGFDITITRANMGGGPQAIITDGVRVPAYATLIPILNVGFSNIASFDLTPFISGWQFQGTSIWESHEVVSMRIQCTSVAAGQSLDQTLTFTLGDKGYILITASTPVDGATGVPLNQVVAFSIRDDSQPGGSGVDGTTLQLTANSTFPSSEVVYDATMGGYQAPYTGNVPVAAGNGFDFANVQRAGGWQPGSLIGIAITAGADLSTPPNPSGPFQGQSFAFTTVSIPGMIFTPTPTNGGSLSPSWGNDPGTGFVDVQETGAGNGDPVAENLSYQINGAGPSFDILIGGVVQAGWSVTSTPLGGQVTRVAFFPTAPMGGSPVIGDALDFTLFADATSDPGQTGTWSWVLANPIVATPTPPNGATGVAQNVIWQVELVTADAFQNIVVTHVTVTVTGEGTVDVYSGGTFQAPYNGAGSQIVNNATGPASDITIFVQRTTPYPLSAHVCFDLVDVGISPAGPPAPPGPYCFDVSATPPPPVNPVKVNGSATGTIDGGTAVLLTGGLIDTTGCSDDFTSGVVGAMWATLAAGSGTVVPVVDDHAILCDTGLTPASFAGLRTVGTSGDIDVEADFLGMLVLTQNGANVPVASFALRVDAANEFRVQVEALLGGYQLRVRIILAGTVLVDRVQPLRGPGQLGTVTIRLVRFGPRVIALFNGVVLLDLGWTNAATKVELLVANDPVLQTRAATEFTGYRRQPQVTFGTEPCVDFALKALAAQILEVRAPKVLLPAIVDVTVAGCSASQTVPQAFTYVLGNRLIVEQTATQALTVLGDSTIKET